MSADGRHEAPVLAGDDRDPFAHWIEHVQAFLELLRRGEVPDPSSVREFETFDAFLHHLVSHLVRRRPWPGADANDMVQDLWLTLFNAPPTLPADQRTDALRRWLEVVLDHERADQVKRYLRHAVERLSPAKAASLPSREIDPAQQYERERVRRGIRFNFSQFLRGWG